jgi:hypothetical protein
MNWDKIISNENKLYDKENYGVKINLNENLYYDKKSKDERYRDFIADYRNDQNALIKPSPAERELKELQQQHEQTLKELESARKVIQKLEAEAEKSKEAIRKELEEEFAKKLEEAKANLIPRRPISPLVG